MIRTILHVHNRYQQPGGEDEVFRAESALLERYGHEVHRYEVSNDDVNEWSRSSLAAATIWNRNEYRAVRDLLRRTGAEVMHVHNTLPLLSPAVYDAARDEGAAVVQTLHNYRLMCPASTFFRDGGVCEDCLGKPFAWPSVAHACYRDSRAASGVVATMLAVHRARRTYHERVDAYIALTEFGRRKFIEGGLPEDKLWVKPHFVEVDRGVGSGSGGQALFVGRLSPEKGVSTLLGAWSRIGERLPLEILGDGPMADEVASAARELPGVAWRGRRSKDDVLAAMGDAALVIVPSTCYETFGLVAIEAYSRGTPVLASRIGAIAEVVEHGRTGRHFRPADADDLVANLDHLLAHPEETRRLRGGARRAYEARYTAESNYERLMEIYEAARRHRSRGDHTSGGARAGE